MKYKILRILRSSKGFVSGEQISNILGVSRTAIWKQINALKEEGYIIEASSKKGYILIDSPDVLTPEEILPILSTHYIGKEILHFKSIDSTNNIARLNAQNGCSEGLVVIAEEQTTGRGRMGRKWSSPKSEAISFSLVLRPNIKPEDASGITLVMGTAVCRAIRKFTGLEAGIKWPNDIIVNNKKLCGILTEMNGEIDAVNYIISGVGINVNTDKFPEEIGNIATSIYIETGRKASRRDIFLQVLYEFEELYNSFKINGLKSILEEFKLYSVTLKKRVRVLSVNESFEGEAIDITEGGLLKVRLDSGQERKVISGDVSIRGINGYAK